MAQLIAGYFFYINYGICITSNIVFVLHQNNNGFFRETYKRLNPDSDDGQAFNQHWLNFSCSLNRLK